MLESYPKDFESEKQLVTWYSKHRWYHGRLARLVAQFLEWQVEEFFRGIRLPVLAKITYRDKSIDSLAYNLKKKRYGRFPVARDAVGDMAGVRVVFYFRDDVELFCNDRVRFFQRWFGRRSFQQRKVFNTLATTMDDRHVGYDSWHFPIRVEPDTDFYRALNDMDRTFLEGLDCEVQLRTTLQDAWAECNHDIRYKLSRVDDTLRNDVVRHKFIYLSEQLRDVDTALVTLKADFTENVQLRSESTRPQQHWRYSSSGYSGAVKIGTVEYGYELLDRADRDEGKTSFTIAPATSVFNVDRVMESLTGSKRYKQLMWDRLQKEEPQFVVAITYDSMVVRATDWRLQSRTLAVELAAYSDQVVTNHVGAQDKLIPYDRKNRRVRDLAIDGNGELLAFRNSPLSNTVGVSCVIRTYGNLWVAGLRSPSVAFDPYTWGCSTSGALNWVELGHWDKRDFDGWFKNGIVREVEEELGYSPDPNNVYYLGLAREFKRLGKPQVFFFIDATISYDNLSAKFRTYKSFESEYLELKPLNIEQARDLISADAKRVNAVCGDGVGIGEELRFNLALALEYAGELA